MIRTSECYNHNKMSILHYQFNIFDNLLAAIIVFGDDILNKVHIVYNPQQSSIIKCAAHHWHSSAVAI